MFLNDLFTIQNESIGEQHAEFTIELNARHAIYGGHFPNDPITPGVCIVQVATDLFSHIMGHEFSIIKAKNIKFLSLIKPNEHPIITYKLNWEKDEATYKVRTTICDEEVTFTKISITVQDK